MNSEQRTMNDFGEMFNVHCSMFIFHWKVVDYPAFRLKEAQPMKLTAIRSLVAILAVFAIMPVCANAQQDFSNVQIKTNKISNNFYTLDGQGGTIGLLVGPDGVFMVDAQFAQLHDKIIDRKSTRLNSSHRCIS